MEAAAEVDVCVVKDRDDRERCAYCTIAIIMKAKMPAGVAPGWLDAADFGEIARAACGGRAASK